jgi:hypothetical protein
VLVQWVEALEEGVRDVGGCGAVLEEVGFEGGYSFFDLFEAGDDVVDVGDLAGLSTSQNSFATEIITADSRMSDQVLENDSVAGRG